MIAGFIGGIVICTFLSMFYFEDHLGGGLYDPDPSASYRHRNKK